MTRDKRIYYNARCCGRTFQGWHLPKREFAPPYERCFDCGMQLEWKLSDGHGKRRPERDTVDRDIPANGIEKSRRIDLGLEILCLLAKPGVQYTYQEIAAFCGCSDGYIFHTERRALRKLRRHLDTRGHGFIADLRAAIASVSRPSVLEFKP